WQYIFYLNIPIGAAALLLARRIVPESRLSVARRRYDPFGAVTVTGGLLLGVYALSQAPLHGWGSARTISLLAVAAVLELAFLVIETRVEAPLLPMRIFRLPTVAGANAVALLLGASFFAFIFVGTLYMQQVLRYSALQTGLAWRAASVTSVALSGLTGPRHPRLGQTRTGRGNGDDRRWADRGGPRPHRGPLLGEPIRPVLRRRRRHRLLVHPGDHRRSRRRRRARGRPRLGPAQHDAT